MGITQDDRGLSARWQELFWALPSGPMRHKLRSLEIDVSRTLREQAVAKVREAIGSNADPLVSDAETKEHQGCPHGGACACAIGTRHFWFEAFYEHKSALEISQREKAKALLVAQKYHNALVGHGMAGAFNLRLCEEATAEFDALTIPEDERMPLDYVDDLTRAEAAFSSLQQEHEELKKRLSRALGGQPDSHVTLPQGIDRGES